MARVTHAHTWHYSEPASVIVDGHVKMRVIRFCERCLFWEQVKLNELSI